MVEYNDDLSLKEAEKQIADNKEVNQPEVKTQETEVEIVEN